MKLEFSQGMTDCIIETKSNGKLDIQLSMWDSFGKQKEIMSIELTKDQSKQLIHFINQQQGGKP